MDVPSGSDGLEVPLAAKRALALLLSAVEDRSPDEESERRRDDERHDRAGDEDPEVIHRAALGATRAPSARIDGTQSPTKIPSCSLPLNQRETDSANETNAATKRSALACLASITAPRLSPAGARSGVRRETTRCSRRPPDRRAHR